MPGSFLVISGEAESYFAIEIGSFGKCFENMFPPITFSPNLVAFVRQ